MHRLGRYLDAPDEWLPSLNRANGSPRQQRTERSVARVQLLRASLKYLDLLSMRVGIPPTGGDMTFDPAGLWRPNDPERILARFIADDDSCIRWQCPFLPLLSDQR
uniref:hypothetical protein n=1 Tax=Paraburkholderia sediminicola TaxID=458836 RepID=UPI0038BBB196